MLKNPYLEVILASLIWSSTGVFVKYLNLAPVMMSFFRLAIPALVLLIFFNIKKIDILKKGIRL